VSNTDSSILHAMNGQIGDSEEATNKSFDANIHLYAEHLKNIGTISIQAHLPTVSNQATKANLSADHCRLSLSHEGEVVSIKLPIQVSCGHNEPTLTVPATPSKDISFRLKVEEKPSAHGLLSNGIADSENLMPWMATELTPETEINCANCSSKLISRGVVKRWKDLPSEGWAEMMDFWHCHKPLELKDRENSEGVSRGIGADSKLVIDLGVGLVSPLDLIFAVEDCMDIEVGVSTPFYIIRLPPSSSVRMPLYTGDYKNRPFPASRSRSKGSVGIQSTQDQI